MTKFVLKTVLKWALVALAVVLVIAFVTLLVPEGPETCLLAKPVIYLYPETETEVAVTLGCADDLTVSIPEYRSGWRVLARPDGTLTDLTDGQAYTSLFWEAEKAVEFDFSEGFCVAGSEVEAFLTDALTQLGLNATERAEFLDYWVPKMQGNAWNLIAFQSSNYEEAAPLTVTPAPDSLLRVFMAWKALDAPVELAPQTLAPFVREGFAVVEWGGTQVD